MQGVICSVFEEDLEVPENPMHVVGKSNGVTSPVNVDTFNKIDYTNVKHIKNSDGSLLRLVLFDISL